MAGKTWTEEEVIYLKKKWSILSVSTIAKTLNRTEDSIRSKGRNMGLGGGGHNKTWTEKEIAYLKENWGIIEVASIAKKLKRSEKTIIEKARHFNLGGSYSSNYISARAIAKLFNVYPALVVTSWKDKHGLLLKKKRMLKKHMWLISMENLMKWLEQNQNVWSSKYLKKYALGEEPKWLKEKRKKDAKDKIILRKNKHWTREEDSKVVMLFKSGYSYKQIAEKVGRTRRAVEVRLQRLDVWNTTKPKKALKKEVYEDKVKE